MLFYRKVHHSAHNGDDDLKWSVFIKEVLIVRYNCITSAIPSNKTIIVTLLPLEKGLPLTTERVECSTAALKHNSIVYCNNIGDKSKPP